VKLLTYLCDRATKPVTWADATWAVRFYEKHGFRQVTKEAKNGLLRTYWKIPARQIETSVVLADKNWTSKAFFKLILLEPFFIVNNRFPFKKGLRIV
jgi:hypothetical protein